MRLVAIALAALAGCEITRQVGFTPDGGSGDERWMDLRLGTRTGGVDLLFVIDDSPSMRPKQLELARRFPAVLAQLERFRAQGNPGHYHIGVVTTDLGGGPGCRVDGRGGRLQPLGAAADADCRAPLGGRYIDLDQAQGTTNVPDGQDVARAFACMSAVGDQGCGFEQPLEAAYRALLTPPPENAGFLRPAALLAVVFVTDEDDCSAPPESPLFDAQAVTLGPLDSYRCTRFGITCAGQQPPPSGAAELEDCLASTAADGALLYDLARYQALFHTPGRLKDNPADVLLFALAGPPQPFTVHLINPRATTDGVFTACAGPPDGRTCAMTLLPSCAHPGEPAWNAAPAVRLAGLVDEPTRATICDPSFAPPLGALGHTLLSFRSGGGCLPGWVRDPQNAACEVVDVNPAGGEYPLPACVGADTKPCWRLEESAECTAFTVPRTGEVQQLRLTIDRDGAMAPPGFLMRARCVVHVP